ncbi:hypothetical protein [Haladaptatus sp. NG-SE-30]
MVSTSVTRWARRFVVTSALFLMVWQLASLGGIARRTEVFLGLFGFVLHMVFGKAYSLVPTYFDRELAFPRAPAIHFPLTVFGTGALVLDTVATDPVPYLGTAGALSWTIGIGVFLTALTWSVRDNLTGSETGTSSANADRRPIDRMANGFMPVAFGYLVLGTYGTLAYYTELPPLFDGYFPQITHLLAAGAATMILFAIGFRLLPRFLVATSPRWLVAIVLPTGALGPLLLAETLRGDLWFRAAAITEAVAILGFAAAYGTLYYRSDRRRVGFYGVLAGVASGVVAVLLGLSFAFGSIPSSLVTAHFRANLLGFLGLTIVGVAYQFYPPAIGSFPGASDRTAIVSILCLGGGLLVEIVGLVGDLPRVTLAGNVLTVLGAGLYAVLLVGLFRERST